MPRAPCVRSNLSRREIAPLGICDGIVYLSTAGRCFCCASRKFDGDMLKHALCFISVPNDCTRGRVRCGRTPNIGSARASARARSGVGRRTVDIPDRAFRLGSGGLQ
ncbi:hypothetical protein [Myxococcus phage Mx4 ts27htf-1hrm-1]|nr:hypothetical protein Mx4_p05 [Myxococcus phage Mx4]WNM70347.1 hypothetical protein [Myxococcus phage Mx4 ts27htf-1hrm-1]